MNKNQSVGIWIVVGLLAVALISMLFVGPVTTTENMTYSDFLSKVRNSEIKAVEIEKDSLTAIPYNDEIKTNIKNKKQKMNPRQMAVTKSGI